MLEKFRQWVIQYADFLVVELQNPNFRIPRNMLPEDERLRNEITSWIISLPHTEDAAWNIYGDLVGTTRDMI